MIDKRITDALASMIYVTRQQMAGIEITEDDQKIRASGLYEDWVAGKHTVGEIYNGNGQTWECYQDYDNSVYPDINPDNPAWFTFNRPLHGKTKETARPFVQPTHSLDIYYAGEYMIYTDNSLYKCKENTNFSPVEYPQAWEVQVD